MSLYVIFATDANYSAPVNLGKVSFVLDTCHSFPPKFGEKQAKLRKLSGNVGLQCNVRKERIFIRGLVPNFVMALFPQNVWISEKI